MAKHPECSMCNEVMHTNFLRRGLCPDCQNEVVAKYKRFLDGLEPEEMDFFDYLIDGEYPSDWYARQQKQQRAV